LLIYFQHGREKMSLEGQQLGRYHLQRVLGMGGMGEVYLATDTLIHRQVAIKVIRSEVSSYPDPNSLQESTRLFQREMKAIATLDHPHILPLFDYGEETVNGARHSFLVMPYRPEGSLATWLQQRPGAAMLSLQDVATLVSQAADALQHAHDHQIIHQDVKPANFLLRFKKDDPDHPDLLLADFGVSRFNTATANVSQSIRGTPASMAPEQWEGRPVPATDQYALAVMAYELLTGRPPFQGGLSQLMYQHFHAAPPPPSSFNPRLPSDVDSVLLHALAKNPQARFATVSAFARAFQQAALSSASTIASELPPGAVPPRQQPSGIFAVLAISPAEARAGGSRTLTLPDGRRITVPLPAGVYDGQVISVQDRAGPGGSDMTLNLKLSIQQADVASAPGSAEQTMRGSNPNLQSPAIAATPAPQPYAGQQPIAPTPPGIAPPRTPLPPVHPNLPGAAAAFPSTQPSQVPQGSQIQPGGGTVAPSPAVRPPRRSSASKVKLALLAGLALILVLASIGIFTAVHNAQVAGGFADATATAQAHIRGTARANHATSTAEAGAIATQIAMGHDMQTATATAYQNLLTGSTGGVPAINDPMSNNKRGSAWEEGTFNDGGACRFAGGAYQATIATLNFFQTCAATATDFGNFAFQVQMKIIKGDCGGVVFRADYLNSKFYYFNVCQDGSYNLYSYVNNSQSHTLTQGNSPAVTNGLNQLNLITVVAKGHTIVLYINKQLVDSVNDSTYSHGQVGVTADETSNPTQVAYTTAEVWTL
jgi:eukaryotic-like serine/threonine-protein kinase